MLNLRDARVTDYPFLKELHHAAYREVVTRQFGKWVESEQDAWFQKGLSEAEFRIIESGGIPVGAIGVHEAPDQLFLAELQILPAYQRQGLGSAVLTLELERARELGLPVRLRVLRQNQARSLYARHGFATTGETETHYLMASRPIERMAP